MYLLPKGKYPNACELRPYILEAMKRYPVTHLMPLDRPVDEKKHPHLITRLASGRYAIKPNITHQGFLFAGMPFPKGINEEKAIREYSFVSSISKEIEAASEKLKSHRRMYSNILRGDFLLMLGSYPPYRLLSDGIPFDGGKRIFKIENPYGLSALYDYSSSLIKLSSNIDVALLHATCDYDYLEGEFKESESKYGVLFVFELNRPFGLNVRLSNLGRMPIGRALHGNYFLYDIPDCMGFEKLVNVKGFVFRQDANESRHFLKKFDKSIELYPTEQNDPILKKCLSHNKAIVSQKAFEDNLKYNQQDKREDNVSYLSQFGCKVDPNFDFRFTFQELSCCKDLFIRHWDTFCSNLFSTYSREGELCKLLKGVPENPLYSKYFNIEEFAEYAGLE